MSKLTDIYGEADRLARNTPPGMAHWAGTGPAGAICKACSEISTKGQKPNMGRCMRWRRQMPKRTFRKWPAFNVHTSACKYWEARHG